MVYSILVVDDDEPVLRLLKEELEGHGYHVLTAGNGQTAMRLAQGQLPDLIVLDIAMPIASGLDVFHALRSRPETLRIPVIFMTGVPSANVQPVLAEGGRVAHLKKPIDTVELLSLIQQFLEHYPK